MIEDFSDPGAFLSSCDFTTWLNICREKSRSIVCANTVSERDAICITLGFGHSCDR